MPSQSLTPLTQVRGRLGPLGKIVYAGPPLLRQLCPGLIKYCINCGGAVVSVLQADTELLEWCQAINCGDKLWFGVGMEVFGAGPAFGYKYWEH